MRKVFGTVLALLLLALLGSAFAGGPDSLVLYAGAGLGLVVVGAALFQRKSSTEGRRAG